MGARVPVPDERMQRVIDMLKSTSPTSLLRASRKSRLTALARPLALNPPLRPARKAASALVPWHSIVWGVAEGATDDIASQGRPDESTSLPLASLAYSPRHSQFLTPIRDRVPTATTLTCMATFPLHPVHSCPVPSPSPVPVSSLPCLLSTHSSPGPSVRSEQEASPEVVGQVP